MNTRLTMAALIVSTAFAVPATAGPLGNLSGGAAGALGGTLSGGHRDFGVGATGALGAEGQLRGRVVRPEHMSREALQRTREGVNSTREAATSKVDDVRDRAQGAAVSASGAAQGSAEGALAAGRSQGAATAAAAGDATGHAAGEVARGPDAPERALPSPRRPALPSADPLSASTGAQGAAQASGNARPLRGARSVEATAGAQGDASAGPASASAGGSAQADARAGR